MSIFTRTRLPGFAVAMKGTLIVVALATICAFASGCGGSSGTDPITPTTGTAHISVEDTTGAAKITVE